MCFKMSKRLKRTILEHILSNFHNFKLVKTEIKNIKYLGKISTFPVFCPVCFMHNIFLSPGPMLMNGSIFSFDSESNFSIPNSSVNISTPNTSFKPLIPNAKQPKKILLWDTFHNSNQGWNLVFNRMTKKQCLQSK